MSPLRRYALGSALLLTLAHPGRAQTPTPPVSPAAPASGAVALKPTLLKPGQVQGQPYKKYLYNRYANDPQATQAIRLFARRQTGGALWLGIGGAFMGFVASQTGTRDNPSGGSTTTTITPLGWGLMLGLFGGVGIPKLSRFSNQKLYEALREYDDTRALPLYVQYKLD